MRVTQIHQRAFNGVIIKSKSKSLSSPSTSKRVKGRNDMYILILTMYTNKEYNKIKRLNDDNNTN
jgi:hypothetical protein